MLHGLALASVWKHKGFADFACKISTIPSDLLRNYALGQGNNAIGQGKCTLGQGNSAFSQGSCALGQGSNAIAQGNYPLGQGSSAIGQGNSAVGL
ncbi:hypothetical protein SUGI_1023060 [Cryptomeria japonica]|nr:hypothetical protein SUGI_1023060 [Cryptomeria japonica]